MDSCGLVCSTRIFVVFIHILMVSVCAIFFIAIAQQFIYKFIVISFRYVPAYCPCNKKHIECPKIQMDEGEKKDYYGRERNRISRKWDNHNQLPRLYLNVVILIHHLRLNQGFVIMDGTIIWSLMCTAIMLFLDISLKSILFSIIINTRLR